MPLGHSKKTAQAVTSVLLCNATGNSQALSDSSCSVHVRCALSRHLSVWTTLPCFVRTENMGKFKLGFFSSGYNIMRQFLESQCMIFWYLLFIFDVYIKYNTSIGIWRLSIFEKKWFLNNWQHVLRCHKKRTKGKELLKRTLKIFTPKKVSFLFLINLSFSSPWLIISNADKWWIQNKIIRLTWTNNITAKFQVQQTMNWTNVTSNILIIALCCVVEVLRPGWEMRPGWRRWCWRLCSLPCSWITCYFRWLVSPHITQQGETCNMQLSALCS